jgi:hypothetical protein
MFGKDVEISVDAHGCFEGVKERLVNLFDPKFRLTISQVESAIILLFLSFDEKEVLLPTEDILSIEVVNYLEDIG